MRASQWLLGLATTMAIAGAAASGCGGSSSSGGTDSGAADVTTDHVEAAVEAAPEAAPMDSAPETAACVAVDADLTTLPVPDASLADGGVNIATCVSCLRANCHSELEACNTDCVCIDTIVNCVAGGAVSFSCIPSGALTDPALQSLGLCIETACASSCTPPKAPTDGGDGGGDGSMGDAAEQ
jgi:hypothetical protein